MEPVNQTQYPICAVELRMVRVAIGVQYATDTLTVAHALIVRLAIEGD